MNRLLLILITVLLSFSVGFTQEKDIPFDKRLFVDQKDDFDAATKEISTGDFYFFDGRDEFLQEALSHFLNAQKFNPYSSILNYKIGICYLYSTNKLKSLSHLEFTYRVNPELDVDLKFYLAQAYQLTGDFEQAITFYKNYLEELPSNSRKQRFFVNKKISESRTGIKLKESPVRAWVDNLGDSVNSEFAEFSPVISADNRVLFYTARRPDSQGQKKDRLGNYFEDIYFSERLPDGTWSAAKNIGPPVNTESHDATVGVAPDGHSILTYQGISSKNGDILITRQQPDGTWETPHSIGISVNTKHHESSATLSFDEKTLFFVSDQPGGFGQHDIYVSDWDEEKQEWSPGRNLGPEVNTMFEEMGVFFHADSKTLYFSSDGHENMGGLDIFRTVFDEETQTWSQPENIGYPINTPDDDIYFVVSGNGRYAYYSSNREDGMGEKDIYRITFLGPKKAPAIPEDLSDSYSETGLEGSAETMSLNAVDKKEYFLLRGKILDGTTQKGLLNARLYVVNSKTNERIAMVNTHFDGSYAIKLEIGTDYALTAAGKMYTINSKILNASQEVKNKEVVLDFEIFPPDFSTPENTSFALRNIYFGFDQTNLDYTAFGSQAQVELDLLADFMREFPEITIELSGHTDRRGSTNYNQSLSERRAEIAKRYLVEKGIEAARIRSVGYGESQPEVPWSQIKKRKTREEKEEAHQLNRRTVVTIIRP